MPTSWIYAFDDAVSLMDKYNLMMDGVSEVYGYPTQYRADFAVQVLYLGVDIQNRRSVNGVGYPQTNQIYSPSRPGNGNVNHWMLRAPEADYVCWHELGHANDVNPLHAPCRLARTLAHTLACKPTAPQTAPPRTPGCQLRLL